MDKFYSIVVNDAVTGLEEEYTDFLNEEDARKSFDEFKDSGCYVIGIKDIMDVDYMTQELKKFFEQSNEEK